MAKSSLEVLRARAEVRHAEGQEGGQEGGQEAGTPRMQCALAQSAQSAHYMRQRESRAGRDHVLSLLRVS